MLWSKSINKCKEILTNPSLTFEFQTNTLKLLVYNYVIVLLIANQDVTWNYTFADSDLAKRLGHELMEPEVLTKFGFCFRLLTILLNTLAVAAVITAKRKKRNYLIPCILWNFYTICAIIENTIEIIWCLLQLQVPFKQFFSILLVATFMLCFQLKLTIQILRFYEYLNYIY